MKSVYIKLTAVGANIAAQFNIKSDFDGCTAVLEVVNTIDLQAGYTCNLVPDTATEICLEEIGGPCEATLNIPIVECTTTTTTTTMLIT